MKIICPICKEKDKDTAMNQVGKDSRYRFYRCPVCGNEAMVASEKHLYDLSESMA